MLHMCWCRSHPFVQHLNPQAYCTSSGLSLRDFPSSSSVDRCISAQFKYNGFAIRWTCCRGDRSRGWTGTGICTPAGQPRCKGCGERLGRQLPWRGQVECGRPGGGGDQEGGRNCHCQLRLGHRWREDHPDGNGGLRPSGYSYQQRRNLEGQKLCPYLRPSEYLHRVFTAKMVHFVHIDPLPRINKPSTFARRMIWLSKRHI